MKPYILFLPLLLLLSSGHSYVHLSARKHLATSTTCLATSQHLGGVDEDPECSLKCSLSSEVIVQTDVRQDKEAKRFLFLISKVEADCPGLELSQLELPVAVTVEGHHWGEEREAEPLWGFSPEAGAEVRGLQRGLVKTHLEGLQVHQGWRPKEVGCTLVEEEADRKVGFIQNCEEGEGEGALSSRLVTQRHVSLQYKTGGRTIERREQRELSTQLRPEVGLLTISTTSLTFLDDVEPTTEYDKVALEGWNGKDLETVKKEGEDEEVVVEKGKKLLVTLSKAKAGSVEAASNFLHLTAFLDTLDPVSTEAFLKKFKTKKAFKHVVEAAAGSKSPFLQAAVFDLLVADKKKKHLLERFLIGVSFSQPREEVVKELVKRLGDVDEEARETMLLAACKLQGGLKGWGELMGAAGETCSTPACHRTLTNCLLAAGKEGRESELVEMVRKGEGAAVERALVALGKRGLVGKMGMGEVERLLMETLVDETSTYEQKVAALSSISLDNGTVDALLPLSKSKNSEFASLVSQVLSSAASRDGSLKLAPFLNSWAFAPPSAQSMHLQQELENIGGFSFQAVMSPAGLRRTHFVLRSSGEEGQEVLRLSTRVGGLSGVLGEAEEGDDAEANASAELSLLGLPLRPFTLFSSMGELMELFWSGAGQERTTLLQGSALLLSRKSSLPLASGLNLEVTLTAAASLETAGQAEVSMWSQSADTKLEVEGSVVVRVEARLGSRLLFISSDLAASALFQLDSSIQMGGDGAVACVKAIVQRGEAGVETKEERRGEEERSSSDKKSFQGLTINLGAKNNHMCNKIKA